MNGLVLIDKPRNVTSHDVVNRWRRLAGTKRVGHLGTLDPMATGLLVLMSGNTTRLARFFERHDKTYDAEIRFGYESDTYDAEGEVAITDAELPSETAVTEALKEFRGAFPQRPPPFSAKKIKGVPAYKLARKDVPVDLQPVAVEIKLLEMRAYSSEYLRVTVTCTAGTYIRSLAHDLGKRLGCGAILSALRRTASGTFDIAAARTFEQLDEMAKNGRLSDALIPPAQILPEFPSAYVDAQTEAQIRLGREFRTSPFVVTPGAPFVKALTGAGQLISIGELKFPNVYHPMMVL